MTGMGGGSLMTPILILLFGFDAKVAVGTDILHGAIFKSFGAARHRMLGTVHARLALWMLARLGAAVARRRADRERLRRGHRLDDAEDRRRRAHPRRSRLRSRRRSSTGAPTTRRSCCERRDKVVAVAIGAVGGFVVGLTSVGSGTFFGLAMLLVFPLTAPKIVGTDITHAAALLWVAGVGHLLHGNVNLHAMGWLLVGSIPGVLLGSQMSIKVPERSLRFTFALRARAERDQARRRAARRR